MQSDTAVCVSMHVSMLLFLPLPSPFAPKYWGLQKNLLLYMTSYFPTGGFHTLGGTIAKLRYSNDSSQTSVHRKS